MRINIEIYVFWCSVYSPLSGCYVESGVFGVLFGFGGDYIELI